MTLWRQVTRGVRALVNRPDTDREIADEVDHWMEQSAAAHQARGLSADDARRAARMELGNPTAVSEHVRTFGWEHAIDDLLADVRYALRRLRASPGFSALAVVTLALGIGASTAIFSAAEPILLRALPYPHPGRVVAIEDAGAAQAHGDVTFGTFREVATRGRSFTSAAVMKGWLPTVTGGGEPERLDGQRVSAAYFTVLGVAPAIGRGFDGAEDAPGGTSVVIISDGLWRRRFGGDSAIVGRTVTLDGDPFTIVGVMPPHFANVVAPEAELWAPLQYDPALPADGREWGHHLQMLARLGDGVTLESAMRDLAAIARVSVPAFARPPWASLSGGFAVTTLQREVTRAVRPALLAIVGAVVLVLAIACVNVTNLLLARGARRRPELAMRAALGAGRWRITRQLLTESLLLALLAGLLAVGIAAGGVRVLAALVPAELARRGAMEVNATVFLFALLVSALAGIATGVVPALDGAGGELRTALHEVSRRTAGARHATRRTLVVAEVALALVLLVGAGLLLRSVGQLLAVRPGFDASHLLTMQLQESGHAFADDSARARLFDRVLASVSEVPGVQAAAFTSQLPLGGDYDLYGARIASATGPDSAGNAAFRYAVTPAYFAMMRIPLRRGRLVDEHDAAGQPPVVVIDESLARRMYGDGDPIGRRIHVGDPNPAYTIVGVVGNVKQTSLADASNADAGAVYFTTTQWHWVDLAQSLVVRTRGAAGSLAPAVRSAIRQSAPDLPIVHVATMDDLVARSAAERRFALVLFAVFGAIALVLAATGVYGLLAGGVEERWREIGIRSALGASRGEIVGLVARQAAVLLAIGLAIGVGAAVVATRGLASLLFGISPLDPFTYAAVAAMLATAGAAACSVPAWRASRVDPAITLRSE